MHYENPLTDILSVSKLNHIVKQTLEWHIGMVQVQGDISNLSKPRSGHLYFSLSDAFAQIHCVFFHARGAFDVLQNGMHVLARGRVSAYPARGSYQLIIESIQPIAAGQLQRAFELLKQKLHQEGLFDERHKKPLPAFPHRIGIITAPQGAALQDVCAVLKKRCPFIEVMVYPSLVQGSGAAPQLIHMIKRANHDGLCDVLILTRGGGSMEDLCCFNDEGLARAIFASRIPIISGVGHEIDFTIADFVADYRALTPTAAAHAAGPDKHALHQKLHDMAKQLTQRINRLYGQKRQALDHAQKRLRDPIQTLHNEKKQLQSHKKRLHCLIQHHLKLQQQKLQNYQRSLHNLSPAQVLERGYALITTPSGAMIHDPRQVHPQDAIIATVHQGTIRCIVQDTEHTP